MPDSTNYSDNHKDRVRVAALGDLHCTRTSRGAFQDLFARIAESADVLALCGDLTDHGLPEEARVLAEELAALSKLPTIGVLGNHDYESGKPDEVRQILCDVGLKLLDGDALEVRGIGFAGAKGFGGGFGRGTLSAFGESTIKAFVQEALDEVMKLEGALARLRTTQRIAILHYAPIRATVENEPLEIFPFLGSSRLEEPLNRYQVTAVVHGHAHNGAPEGRIGAGAPCYNVSLPLMRKTYPERPPFRILDLSVPTPQAQRIPVSRQAPVETHVG